MRNNRAAFVILIVHLVVMAIASVFIFADPERPLEGSEMEMESCGRP